MSRKLVLYPHKIIDAGDMSDDIESSVTNIQFLDNIAMEVAWTGSPVGALQVLGSLTGDNWVALQFTPTAPSGSAGSALLDMKELSFPLIKLIYISTSGTGSLNAWIGGKEI